MKQKNKYPKAITRITILLVTVGFVIWLTSMICLTSIAAEYEARKYAVLYNDYAYSRNEHELYNFDFRVSQYAAEENNYEERMFWSVVSLDNVGYGFGRYEGDDYFLPYGDWQNLWESEKVYSALAVYDTEGNCIENSGTEFFFFEYMTKEQWDKEDCETGVYARAKFDKEKLTEVGKKLMSKEGIWPHWDYYGMRFTGSFDGTEFVPVRIDYVDGEMISEGRNRLNLGSYVSEVYAINTGDLWVPIYENPEAVSEEETLVTLYATWEMVDRCWVGESPSFTYAENEYLNLDALLEKMAADLVAGAGQYAFGNSFDGFRLVIPSVSYVLSQEGDVLYYVVGAIYCMPWLTAMWHSIPMYVATFLIMAVLIYVIWLTIRRQLIEPMESVGYAMLNNQRGLKRTNKSNWKWQEGKDLEQVFHNDKVYRRQQEDEITRLNTALDYAKDAEQNRRQMVSNIAHELKTPLAIIHSYAEGLQENIAENKREQYLNVIMAESERMDEMVLEMLDLSRLEAGRVKLSRTEVSLTELTPQIFEKLDLAIAAKELKVQYDFPDDGEGKLLVDKVRISQVIENFATNAVKYTPYGGNIWVRIVVKPEKTTFIMENESEPMRQQDLVKVWDTFYRTDESRSSKGTGLGLAIAKNIVELHGGTCNVRNTERGVEFLFTI